MVVLGAGAAAEAAMTEVARPRRVEMERRTSAGRRIEVGEEIIVTWPELELGS